jgi:hypothetical protein
MVRASVSNEPMVLNARNIGATTTTPTTLTTTKPIALDMYVSARQNRLTQQRPNRRIFQEYDIHHGLTVATGLDEEEDAADAYNDEANGGDARRQLVAS